MKIAVNTNRKNNKIVQSVQFLKKTIHVEHHVWSRRSRSPGLSRIALRLRLHQNDATPRGSGSATLFATVFKLTFSLILL
jgi:hypothetical protein